MDALLVIGESLVDVVRDGSNESRHAGGSPLNVAYGLAQLGVDVALLTRIGRDPDGALIEHHLRRAGVALLPASLRDKPTSTAVATISSDGSARYQFDVDWDLEAIDQGAAAWVHLGSISTFLSPGADTIESFLVTTSATVSYDPNIRAALLPDNATARQRFERIARHTTVLKMSDEDGAWLYPELDESALLARVLSLGPRVVVITRGANGAVLATPRHRVEVAAKPVVVRDTVGAGDTFMAALISQLHDLDVKNINAARLRQIGEFAVAAAALTCSRVGADLPSRAEVLATV